MRKRKCWKKGFVLLQTLIISILLSMIAVMLMKWVLARHTASNRMLEGAIKTNIAVDHAQSSSMTLGTPQDNTATVDGRRVTFTQDSAGEFTTTVEDPAY